MHAESTNPENAKRKATISASLVLGLFNGTVVMQRRTDVCKRCISYMRTKGRDPWSVPRLHRWSREILRDPAMSGCSKSRPHRQIDLKMFRLIVAHVFSIVLVALSPQGSLGIGVVELAPPGTDFDELPFASSLNAGSQELDISVEVGYVSARAGGFLPGFSRALRDSASPSRFKFPPLVVFSSRGTQTDRC